MDKIESFRIATDIALKWFEIHVSQRLTMMRFFLALAALCIGAYLTAFHAGNLVASIVIAVLLACLAFLFKQFDRRTAQLIKHSEVVLRFSGAALAKELGTDEIDIATRAEIKDGVLSFRQILNLVYWLIGFAALVGLFGAVLAFFAGTQRLA
jgi:MFS superfamily sulfate permease-like transporter